MNRTINTSLLWNGFSIDTDIIESSFSFNGWNMDNGSTIRVTYSNHDDVWSIDFKTYDTPLEDWGGVLWKYYRKKDINIKLSVSWESFEELNDLIDEIKYRTSITEWLLKITINGVEREWTATCTSLKFNRNAYNVSRCGDVSLTFTCVNPHSKTKYPIIEDFFDKQGEFSFEVAYDWRAETFPMLYINIDDNESDWITFSLNGYEIAIDEHLNVGDTIIFNWENKRVTKNWIEVEYTWPFTPINYGWNVFILNSDSTYSWTLSFFKKYI